MKTNRIILVCLVVCVAATIYGDNKQSPSLPVGFSHPITVSLPDGEKIVSVTFLEDEQALIVGGNAYSVVGKRQILWSGNVWYSSYADGAMIAFAGGPTLAQLRVQGNQLEAVPTKLPSRVPFVALPGGYMASLQLVDLHSQVLEVAKRLDAIKVSAERNNGQISEQLIPELLANNNGTTVHEWRKAIRFMKERIGQTIGADELSRLVQGEKITAVRVFNPQGIEVAGCLQPSLNEGIKYSELRYAGWWGNDRLYVVNTLEPKLFVLGFDPTAASGQILWVEKEINFREHLEEINSVSFNYFSPQPSSPEFTPIMSVFALGDVVVVRVMDMYQEKGKSALLVFQNNTFVGSVVTSVIPVHASKNFLVVMGTDNTFYLLSSPLELLQLE